jgi:uncharacterized protein YecE (DUF72 family)
MNGARSLMKFYVGMSGYSYKEWKGSFYPDDLPDKDMLRHYAEKLPAVEINNTFYRLPRASVIETWGKQVKDGFRFSIKASRRITHMKRLRNTEDETGYLLKTVAALGDRLGAVLFQLPPFLQKDVAKLQAFLPLIPDHVQAAFEFRHDSWMDDDVLQCLQDRNCALCLADAEEGETKIVSTADWGYARLRRASYSDEELAEWAEQLRSRRWNEAYVFFKHEEAVAGPELADRFLHLTASG